MALTHWRGEDPVAAVTRNDEREQRQAAAMDADSARIRAGHAAGRDSRSIGLTRTKPARS